MLLILTRERMAVIRRLDNCVGFAFSSNLDRPTMNASDVRHISQIKRRAVSARVLVDLDL